MESTRAVGGRPASNYRPAMMLVAWFSVGALACTGTVNGQSKQQHVDDDPSDEGGQGGEGDVGGQQGGSGGTNVTTDVTGDDLNAAEPLTCKSQGPQPGKAPLARLTNEQFANTVADLFPKLASMPSSFDLAPAAIVKGFENNVTVQTPARSGIEAQETAVESISLAASNALDKVLPCTANTAATETSCGAEFIKTFGAQAFRRPLTADETSRVTDLFTKERSASGFKNAVRSVIEFMLQAPQFLYRPEFGAGKAQSGVVALTPYETATRLSYFFWDTMPDAELFEAARSGGLAKLEEVQKQAARLIASPRAKNVVAAFHRQWLEFNRLDNLKKSATAFPAFNAQMSADMKESLARFVDAAFWDKQGGIATLLTSPTAFVNKSLAPLYGATSQSTTLTEINVNAEQRAGLFTQVGILAALAKETVDSPIYRGMYVLDRWLCSPPPPPPKDVPPLAEISTTDAPQTTRQRVEASHSPPKCAACHNSINGLGFGFENYDALGVWRTKENGLDVDASSKVTDSRDVDGDFTGAVALAKRLSSSEQVKQCVATQWFRYAVGRTETTNDSCVIKQVIDQFSKGNGDLKSLMLAVASSDSFRFREVSQ